MYDIAAIRVGIGALILLLIVLMPVRGDSGSHRAFLGFLAGAAGALLLTAALLRCGDFVLDGGGDQYVKHEVDRLDAAHAADRVPRNLLILDGSSQTELGISPVIVQAELARRGYDATVLTLSQDGGNHLERYQIMRRLTEEIRRHGLGYSPNTQLLLEVHQRYDTEPLRYFKQNQQTLRSYYYSTPENFLFAIQYFRLLGPAAKRKDERQLGGMLGHVLVSSLHVGMLPQMARFDTLMGESAYKPFNVSLIGDDFTPYDADRFGPDRVLGKVRIPRAAIEARVKRLQGLFGDSLTGTSYFQVPSLDDKKMRYGHQFCQSLAANECIDGGDPAIYGPLDHAEYYYNRDHLSLKGARMFSVYFAQQLVAHGLVVK